MTRLPDAGRAALLRRHLLPARPRAAGCRASPSCCARSRDAYRDRRDDVERAGRRGARRRLERRRRAAGASPRPLDAAIARRRRAWASSAVRRPRGRLRRRAQVPALARARVPAAARCGGARTTSTRAQMVDADARRRWRAGGIYDQLGGGFHRYSVDAIWLVPHFEKMLYDNALLARAYALAHRVTGRRRAPRGRRGDARLPAARDARAGRRLLLGPGRRLAGRRGRRSSSGPPDELAEVLERRARRAAVTLRYGVRPGGNFEGASILHVAAPMDAVASAGARRGAAARVGPRASCYAARAGAAGAGARRQGAGGLERAGDRGPRRRRRASWTGPTTSRPPRETAAFLLERLVVDGRLRAHLDGRPGRGHLGYLDDHADLATACSRSTRRPSSRAGWRRRGAGAASMLAPLRRPGRRRLLLRRLRRRGAGRAHPRPRGPPDAGRQLPGRLGAAAARRTSTGDPALERIALDAPAPGRGDDAAASRRPSAPRWWRSTSTPPEPREIAIVGPARRPAHGRPAARPPARPPAPTRVIAVGDPGRPGRGRRPRRCWPTGPLVDGAPAAYVCRRFACRRPGHRPEALAAELAPPERGEAGRARARRYPARRCADLFEIEGLIEDGAPGRPGRPGRLRRRRPPRRRGGGPPVRRALAHRAAPAGLRGGPAPPRRRLHPRTRAADPRTGGPMSPTR